jgi:ABC-type phosphate transport system substrate-binding protein
MIKMSKGKVGLAALGAVGMCAAVVTPASADVYPQAGDVVLAGSDTSQAVVAFMMDGTIAGTTGYNSNQPQNRAFSFDATADADGRAVYQANSGNLLAATSVMRAGTKPVIRPNGSSAGIRSLYQDPYKPGVAGNPNVQIARSSRLPTCAENTAASNAGFGGLHVYRHAVDDLAMGAATTTNAPAGLTIQQVIKIYDGTYLTWGAIPGYSGPNAGNTIIPMIPQSGSGTRTSFTNDLQAANGGNPVPLSNPNLLTVQESDFNSFVAGNSADRIAPFSGGRIGLNNSGYYGSDAQNKVQLLLGAPPNGGSAYDNQRGIYLIVRESDTATTGPTALPVWQPGGTRSWVRTLVAGNGSVAQSPAYAGNMAAGGMTQSYADLGTGTPNVSCTP